MIPRDIFLFLGATAYFLSFIAMAFFWWYAAKKSKFKILCCIYWFWASLFLLMCMGFEFDSMTFDVGLISSFWDPPSFVPTLFMIFVLARFSLGSSLTKAISTTLDKKKETEFSWWIYLASVLGSSAVFALFSAFKEFFNDASLNQSLMFFCLGMVGSLIFSILALPLPLIQKLKNQRMDPWA